MTKRLWKNHTGRTGRKWILNKKSGPGHVFSSNFDFSKFLHSLMSWLLPGLGRLRRVVLTSNPFCHTTLCFWKKLIFGKKLLFFGPGMGLGRSPVATGLGLGRDSAPTQRGPIQDPNVFFEFRSSVRSQFLWYDHDSGTSMSPKCCFSSYVMYKNTGAKRGPVGPNPFFPSKNAFIFIIQ